MYNMKLQTKYFELVKSGEKIFEVRLFDEKRKLLKVGDKITFSNLSNEKEQITCLIENLHHYNSFEEMTNFLSPELIGMKGLSKDEIIKIYHSFYMPEDEKKFGVLAIKIQLVK